MNWFPPKGPWYCSCLAFGVHVDSFYVFLEIVKLTNELYFS